MDNNAINEAFVRAFLSMAGFDDHVAPWKDTYIMRDSVGPPVLVVVRNGAVSVGYGMATHTTAVKVSTQIPLSTDTEVFARRLQNSINEVMNDPRRTYQGSGETGSG